MNDFNPCRSVMRLQMKIGICVLAVIFLFSIYFVFRMHDTHKQICPIANEPRYIMPVYFWKLYHGTDDDSEILLNSLKDDRNKLSKELNMLRRKIGQLDCERDNKKTNDAGGWCRSFSRENGGEHMTDMLLVQALSQFLQNKKVGSFGDGPGAYKRELMKLNQITVYDAYDGAPYCEETSEGRVKFMDLTVPQYGIPMYDWVISLEVAEHIPMEYENVYVDNLVRHAKVGIILSWAVPDQEGLAHVNNRPLAYVVNLMEFHGFRHDLNASKMLQEAASFDWLRTNINVYRREMGSYINVLKKWYT